jgi:DNA-binding IclR family transcriptional regulator
MNPAPEARSNKPQGAAASLLNGLAVLEAFSASANPLLGVTEIFGLVGLHKSTVSRMLNGLTHSGYVQRDEATGRYRLGRGMISLAGPLLAELDVRRAALPHLEAMTRATRETAAISVWNGGSAIVVEQVASPHLVKHSGPIGTRYNKFASSSVRVFMAELPPGDAGRLLEYGVSAPVRDYRGMVVGCITASAPRSRVQQQGSAEELRDAVLEAARVVSARLGGAASHSHTGA